MKKVIASLMLSLALISGFLATNSVLAGEVVANGGCGPRSGCTVSDSTDTNITDSGCTSGYICAQNNGSTETNNRCTCQKAFGAGLEGVRGQAGLSNTSVPAIVGNVIKVILGVSGTVALIFIIWGGIQWMISKGDGTKIGNARKLMTSGMIGIAIIAAAYAITDFVIKQISVVAGA